MQALSSMLTRTRPHPWCCPELCWSPRPPARMLSSHTCPPTAPLTSSFQGLASAHHTASLQGRWWVLLCRSWVASGHRQTRPFSSHPNSAWQAWLLGSPLHACPHAAPTPCTGSLCPSEPDQSSPPLCPAGCPKYTLTAYCAGVAGAPLAADPSVWRAEAGPNENHRNLPAL